MDRQAGPRQKVPGSQSIELRVPCVHVGGGLFHRLHDDLVANLTHSNFRALETELLWQAHGLASAMHEKLGGRLLADRFFGAHCHGPAGNIYH